MKKILPIITVALILIIVVVTIVSKLNHPNQMPTSLPIPSTSPLSPIGTAKK